MSLQTIAHYKLVSKLGEGGMGAVYRATDTKLNRDVAIKVLPEVFAQDVGRMARFEREAQVLASLNHPNIAAIYGVEERALIIELVDGPTLEERIQQGAIPLDEALVIARQIGEALEYAHERGVVHRDLKPADIKLSTEARVKVLDFGLAKAMTGDIMPADPANSPTLPMGATQMGVILGTAGYMAPEQAKGKSVDKRADIWSFGVVLYEMLTGRQLFGGETVTDILASVVKSEPDLAGLPGRARTVVARCLSKDPRERWGSIGDVRWALENAQTAPGTAPSRSRSTMAGWIAAALLAVAAAAGWLHTSPEPARTVTRSMMTVAGNLFTVELSGDGTRLVYGGAGGGSLWLRMMDQTEGYPIPGANGGRKPAFSPDGQWIAYIGGVRNSLKLKKIPVTGGTSIDVCDLAPGSYSLYRGDDDQILIGQSKGLQRIPAAGGRIETLLALENKDGVPVTTIPQLLPGGRAVLFTIGMETQEDSKIAVLDLKTHAWRVLVNSAGFAKYLRTGHLVYHRGNALIARPFDVKRLAVTGAEVPVLEGVTGYYAVSSSGLLVFRTGDNSRPLSKTSLAWMARSGDVQPLPEAPQRWFTFRLSPDGKKVAGSILPESFSNSAGNVRIWIYDIERGILAPFTSEDSYSVNPVWSSDSRSIAFTSRRGGKWGIYRAAADSSSQPELLVATDFSAQLGSWTPDGEALVGTQPAQDNMSISVLPLTGGSGDRKFRRLHPDAKTREKSPALSPDGKWLAYISSPSERSEVFVAPFAGSGGVVQVSNQGGTEPRWSRDGRQLFYVEGTNPSRLMSVAIPAGSLAGIGKPQALAKLPGTLFDVAPDGKRFLVLQQSEVAAVTAPQNTFVVITDWFTDLLRRAPVKQ